VDGTKETVGTQSGGRSNEAVELDIQNDAPLYWLVLTERGHGWIPMMEPRNFYFDHQHS